LVKGGFLRGSLAGRDYADDVVILAVAMTDNQNAKPRGNSEDHKAIFGGRVLRIGDDTSGIIEEDRLRFFKGDAVPLSVKGRFS